jgi:hypothetical protein
VMLHDVLTNWSSMYCVITEKISGKTGENLHLNRESRETFI